MIQQRLCFFFIHQNFITKVFLTKKHHKQNILLQNLNKKKHRGWVNVSTIENVNQDHIHRSRRYSSYKKKDKLKHMEN